MFLRDRLTYLFTYLQTDKVVIEKEKKRGKGNGEKRGKTGRA